MQEQARRYFLTDLRNGNTERKTLRDIRLAMGLCDQLVIQKDGGNRSTKKSQSPES